MILLEVHPKRVAILPLEGQAPGTVHVEAVSDRLALQPVEVEAGHVEVGEGHGFVEDLEAHERPALQVRPDTRAPSGLKELTEPGMAKAPDHRRTVSRLT